MSDSPPPTPSLVPSPTYLNPEATQHPTVASVPIPNLSPLEISEYAMSLANSADSAEASLAVAKLRKINQGLRVGLRDATAGWREAVVLCRDVEKRCDTLYAEVEDLKSQRSALKSNEGNMLDRIRSLETLGESLKEQIEVSKVEGLEVLKQFEAECRGREAALRQLEDAREVNKKLTAKVSALEAEREERENQDARDRQSQEEMERINKSAEEEFLMSTLPDNPVDSNTSRSLPQPNNIDSVHASIAKSIAGRFEETIKERIKQRSVAEVRAIEAAVRHALEGLELEKRGSKKKKGGGRGKKGASARVKGGFNKSGLPPPKRTQKVLAEREIPDEEGPTRLARRRQNRTFQ
mmetsp:Transcript_11726/g.23993  ORF Transcript_11726/g.23993 Transcript_11726/m.23993 type:complete len:352 (+) Transcript_11726:37-1092(+)